MAGELYLNSRVDNAYYEDYEADVNLKCKVIIDGKNISVDTPNGLHNYKTGKPEASLYKGQEIAPGHFKLNRIKNSNGETDSTCVATLHKVPDSNIMEGYWDERGIEKGFWRITLIK